MMPNETFVKVDVRSERLTVLTSALDVEASNAIEKFVSASRVDINQSGESACQHDRIFPIGMICNTNSQLKPKPNAKRGVPV